MNKKNYSFDLEMFRDMLQICPNLPLQKFVDTPFEEEFLAFIRELSYSGELEHRPSFSYPMGSEEDFANGVTCP
ncbi:hypothetical protein Tco_0200926 [Tanacetum coccineum]